MSVSGTIMDLHTAKALDFYGLAEEGAETVITAFFKNFVELSNSSLADQIRMFKTDLNDDTLLASFSADDLVKLSKKHLESKLRLEITNITTNIYNWLTNAGCNIEKRRVTEHICEILGVSCQ